MPAKPLQLYFFTLPWKFSLEKTTGGGFLFSLNRGGGVFNAKIFNRGGFLMKNRLQGGVLEIFFKKSRKIKRKCKKMFLEYAKTIKNSSVLKNIFGF